VTPEQIVTEARSWLGVRWHHQGRSRAGVDCLGMVHMVGVGCGLPRVTEPAYGRLPSGDRLVEELQRYCVRCTEPAVGLLAVFRFDGHPKHVGFIGDYLHGGLSLIHAYAINRKVVEHRLDDAWRARIVALFDLPGVER